MLVGDFWHILETKDNTLIHLFHSYKLKLFSSISWTGNSSSWGKAQWTLVWQTGKSSCSVSSGLHVSITVWFTVSFCALLIKFLPARIMAPLRVIKSWREISKRIYTSKRKNYGTGSISAAWYAFKGIDIVANRGFSGELRPPPHTGLKTCHNSAGVVCGDWMSLLTLKATESGHIPIQHTTKKEYSPLFSMNT